MISLEHGDIQDILIGYPHYPRARYLFLRLERAPKARDWLARITSRVTTADRQRASGSSALNVGLSWTGLAALGVAEETLHSFPEEFRVGMAGRAEHLGDINANHREHCANHPEHWEPDGPGTTEIHAVVIVHAGTESELDEQCRWVGDSLVALGEIVSLQDGNRLQGDGPSPVGKNQDKPLTREHFGFVDGISQPIIEGLRKGNAAELLPGQGVRQPDGSWRPLRAGEIILGYPDEENVQAAGPTPPALARNGSYLVYRKLHQDVAAFRRLKADQGKHYPEGPDALTAKMMGRHPDGTPLTGSGLTRSGGGHVAAFTYADDLDGRHCPIGAHIRRANPRDGFASRDKIVHRHRMLRRGIPYGPPLPDGALDDDGQERGLLFVCLCASIARQFEFVQGQWFNDGNSLGLGNDQDPLLGNEYPGTNLTISGARPWFLSPIPPLVTVRGGEYFFLPGRRALAHLAGCSVH